MRGIMITTVIFDFFGVVSSEVAPFWFGARFAREEAIRLKQEYMEPADHGDISKEELFARLSALSGEAAEDIEAEFSRLAVINRDTVEVIKALKGKYKVGLLSNAQAEWLEDIFVREDLHGLFDLEVISGRVRATKPSVEIYRIALERLNVTADEAVFIDDNPKNVAAAETLGIHGIVFESADKLRCDLSDLDVKI